MAIQYAGGTIVNTTYTSDGTRGQMLTQITAALTAAGWSTISGGGTSDVLMESAVTPQGLKIRFRFFDPGTGNCIRVILRNNDLPTALASNAAYMLPTNGKIFRIIANKHQFFWFSSGALYRATAREIVMGGVPYTWTFTTAIITSAYCGWMRFNGPDDTSTANLSTWRDTLGVLGGFSISVYGASIMNATLVNYSGFTLSYPQILIPVFFTGGVRETMPIFLDGSAMEMEPLLSFSFDTTTVALSGRIVGQLWDASVMYGTVPGETTTMADGSHSLMAITDQGTDSRMTLYLAVT